MKIVKFDNQEYTIWKSNNLKNISIPRSLKNKESLKTLYFLFKYSNLLFSNDIILVKKNAKDSIYINVYEKKPGEITKLKDFRLFYDFNINILNDKLYMMENNKDELSYQRIQKFTKIEKYKKIQNNTKII